VRGYLVLFFLSVNDGQASALRCYAAEQQAWRQIGSLIAGCYPLLCVLFHAVPTLFLDAGKRAQSN
jgi:hypothetical protein